MSKLHQAVTVRKARKSILDSQITEAGRENRKPENFNGLQRRFRSIREDEPAKPDEKKHVQRSAGGAVAEYRKMYAELFDLEARVEYANCSARGDIVVDGTTILAGVPAPLLLHLEKKIAEIGKLISELPVLDPSESWTHDHASNQYKNETSETASTRKVQKGLVLHPATVEHPAQTQLITVDEIVGYWATTKTSAALPVAEKEAMSERCSKLLMATKAARSQANLIDAPETKIGDVLMGFLFK